MDGQTVLFSGYMFLCEPFMHPLALDAEIAIQSGLSARRLISGLFPFYWFKALTKVSTDAAHTLPFCIHKHHGQPSEWIIVLRPNLQSWMGFGNK
jgi:hypothetical protein